MGQSQEEEGWLRAALSLITRLDCDRLKGMSGRECAKVRLAPSGRFAAHVATAGHGQRIRISHPDAPEEKDGRKVEDEALQGIVVLDPMADRAFGHPLFVFRVWRLEQDQPAPERLKWCTRKFGLVFGECHIFKTALSVVIDRTSFSSSPGCLT